MVAQVGGPSDHCSAPGPRDAGSPPHPVRPRADVPPAPGPAPAPWYAVSPDDLVAALGADQAAGLSSARAAELLVSNGPNELPEEGTRPSWLRFLDEYRSFMQIILVGAATVSLL